jgi:hypothetical protein
MVDRAYSDLVPQIMPSVPGASQPLIVNQIRATAVEVCERTLAWRYELADVALVQATYSYAYVPPSGAEVHSIFTASINTNIVLKNATMETFQRQWPDYPSSDATKQSSPQYFMTISPNAYQIIPVPDGATTYTLKMHAALRPTKASTGFDEIFFNDLEQVIIHGVLQELLVLPGQMWSDRELAAYHAKQFVFGVAERRARATLGAARVAPVVRMNAWA